jgi:dipeptidyl aminopeptidase/acylaminoacyl peptidase
VQTQRFKAAVAMAPANIDRIFQYSNLRSDGSSISVLVDEGQLGGTPWERRDRYIENSPIFYLDRVETPLLIVQGTRDTAVPDRESDMIFVGLRRLGKEVEYAKYEHEGHLINGYANQVDYLNRIIDWFGGYLKTP